MTSSTRSTRPAERRRSGSSASSARPTAPTSPAFSASSRTDRGDRTRLEISVLGQDSGSRFPRRSWAPGYDIADVDSAAGRAAGFTLALRDLAGYRSVDSPQQDAVGRRHGDRKSVV